MLAKDLQQIINDAVTAERVIGTSVVVAQRGKIIFEQCAGWANREQKIQVTAQTLFRLASMTKPIVSATAMALLEKGILELGAPITHWLPEFTPVTPDGTRAVITLRHLLTHTAGLSYGFSFLDNEPYFSAGISDGLDERVLSLDENLQRLTMVPLLFAPGTSWNYSLAIDVLGAVIEKACHQPLPQAVEQYVTKPLNMRDTTFHVAKQDVHRLATAYADSSQPNGKACLMQEHDQVRPEGCGHIHYAPGRITNPKAYPSGGSGMAGTAWDYLVFLETLRQGGLPILQPNSVALLTEDALSEFDLIAAGPGFGYSMGFAVVRNSQMAGTPRHAGSYEWGGVYGSKMFVDPKNELTVVILTNTALEGLFGRFSVDITNAVYSNVGG